MSTDGEQLYSTICDIINNHSLSELGLLLTMPNEVDKDDNIYYPFIFVEGNLGVPVPVIHRILAYASSEFMKCRQQREKDLQTLELPSRVLFMLNPEHYSAANARKMLIQSKVVDAQAELTLINLMFTIPRHSKSSIAWHHRKWIQNHLASCSTYSIDLRQEFQLCQRATTLYPKNYYAWTYRHWLLMLLPNGSDMLQEEYAWCRKWVESNVSDHSGIQHLERCLLRVKKSTLDLIDHTNWLRDNIKRYPGHESLWCHLRFCASLIRPQNQMLLNFETKFVEVILKKCHQSADDAETQMQMQLALRYGLWLSHLVRIIHLPSMYNDLYTWSVMAGKTYTKELEKVADQPTFYKLFAGWSCRTRMTIQSNKTSGT